MVCPSRQIVVCGIKGCDYQGQKRYFHKHFKKHHPNSPPCTEELEETSDISSTEGQKEGACLDPAKAKERHMLSYPSRQTVACGIKECEYEGQRRYFDRHFQKCHPHDHISMLTPAEKAMKSLLHGQTEEITVEPVFDFGESHPSNEEAEDSDDSLNLSKTGIPATFTPEIPTQGKCQCETLREQMAEVQTRFDSLQGLCKCDADLLPAMKQFFTTVDQLRKYLKFPTIPRKLLDFLGKNTDCIVNAIGRSRGVDEICEGSQNMFTFERFGNKFLCQPCIAHYPGTTRGNFFYDSSLGDDFPVGVNLPRGFRQLKDRLLNHLDTDVHKKAQKASIIDNSCKKCDIQKPPQEDTTMIQAEEDELRNTSDIKTLLLSIQLIAERESNLRKIPFEDAFNTLVEVNGLPTINFPNSWKSHSETTSSEAGISDVSGDSHSVGSSVKRVAQTDEHEDQRKKKKTYILQSYLLQQARDNSGSECQTDDPNSM